MNDTKTDYMDIQRLSVAYMTTQSWQNIPHIAYLYEPDITGFYAAFKQLNQSAVSENAKITFNTLMIKVIVEGLKSAPVLNSFIDYRFKKSVGKLSLQKEINIAIPWLLDSGQMITPTIFNTNDMSLADISSAVSAIGAKLKQTNLDELLYEAARARVFSELKKGHFSILRGIIAAKKNGSTVKRLTGEEKKYYALSEKERLTSKDIVSGTVTLSNIGSLYKKQKGHFGLLEIIPPQVFVVGIGAMQEKPGVYTLENGQKEIGIRKVLPMCLAFDHRALDFMDLVPFLERLDHIFETPGVINNW